MIHTLTDNTRTVPAAGADNILGPNVTYARTSPLSDLLAWLPALFILVGLPIVAVVATKYVFLPSVKEAYAQAAQNEIPAPMFVEKIALGAPVAAGTHNGFRSLALIGSDGVFLDRFTQNKAKLEAVAQADLKGTTIADLDKAGAVESLQTKLQSDFNRAMGGAFVKEVYIALWPPS